MSTAEIIAVGSELLLGGRTETNSVFLAELLAEQGIQVRWKTVVGDSLDDLGDAVAPGLPHERQSSSSRVALAPRLTM